MVVALNNSLTVDVAQFQHLVDQLRDAVGILDDFIVNLMPCPPVNFQISVGEYLGKATEDVQRCAYLVRHLLDERSLHARRLFGAFVSYFQFTVGFLQTQRCLMAEIDDEHETEDHQHQCQDRGKVALTYQIRLLFDEFLFFLLGIIDGSQLKGCIPLHAYNGAIQFVTDLIAHLIGRLHALSAPVSTEFGQQIVLDDVHRGCYPIFLHLLVQHLEVFCSFHPAVGRHEVVDCLQLAFVSMNVVRLQRIVEHLFSLGLIAETL